MTLPVLVVFNAACSQLFTGWHYEFTFSNDTVTALDLDLWSASAGDSEVLEQHATQVR